MQTARYLLIRCLASVCQQVLSGVRMTFRDWSTADVAQQLKALGFGQYAATFQANEIAGAHLPGLTEDHLKEMGVTSVGHRILMLRRFSDIVAGRISAPPRPARLLSDPPVKEGDARAAEPRRVTTAIES